VFSFGFSSGKASAKPATRVKIVIKNFILSAIRFLGWKWCSIRLIELVKATGQVYNISLVEKREGTAG